MSFPKEFPKIIYKYRNWNDCFHKDVLIKNQLYLASPKKLNDPFDCRIPIDFGLLNTKERISEYAKLAICRYSKKLIEQKKDIQLEIAKVEDMLLNGFEDFQMRNENLQSSFQDKYQGVLSFTKEWNSILLWSHYANYHEGYCVGYWCEKMVNSNFFGQGGSVNYSEDYPPIDPIRDDYITTAIKQTRYKAIAWEYEKEFRFTKLYFPNEPEHYERIVNLTDDFIAEVIIGLKTPKNDEYEILNIAKKRNLRTYKIVKVPMKFRLERIEI